MNFGRKLFFCFMGFFVAAMLFIGLFSSNMLSPVLPVEAQNGVTGFANLRIQNFYRAQPRVTIPITYNATLNTTGSYTRISSVAAVGTSGENITVKPAGTILFLVNVGGFTVTFTESTHLKSAGNIALGATDTAILVSDGTFWTQLAGSNN